MQNTKKSAGESDSARSLLPQKKEAISSTSIIAAIGFSCWFGWELTCVFAPASKLVPHLSLFEITETRIPFIIALVATLALAYFKADWLFDNRNRALPLTCSFSLAPIIMAVLAYSTNGSLPLFLHYLAWFAFGIGQGGFLLYWAAYFSLVPTRYTPVVITFASAFGTFLFVVATNLVSPSLSLFSESTLLASSLFLLTFLSRRIPREKILPTKKFDKFPLFTFSSALSVATHHAAYGFTTVTLFTLGPTATVIGCATGLIGTLLCLIWYKYGSKLEAGPSMLQRVTLPPIIIGLLALGYVDDFGKLICCSLANIALSHFVVMGWINTVTANSEFQFHPILCSSLSRIPGWIGFFGGTVCAFILYFLHPLSGADFQIATIVIVVIVTSASALYGMDDTLTKRRLAEILNKKTLDVPEETPGETSGFFQLSCDEVAKTYDLSRRETEVFAYLARGRNAEYISEQLFVSNSTVKTHIYHIYQKMNISSQQHLMNAVEAVQREKGKVKP